MHYLLIKKKKSMCYFCTFSFASRILRAYLVGKLKLTISHSHISTHLFTHTYFKKLQTTLLKLLYQTPPKVSQYFMIFQEPPIGPSEEGSVPLLHPSPGLESPVSSKEADQPSPVSVLEAPFTDDLSSCSECFESLNADLHGNFKHHLFSNS